MMSVRSRRAAARALLVGLLLAAGCGAPCKNPDPVSSRQIAGGSLMDRELLARLERALLAKHGEGQIARIQRGLEQVLSRWRPEDGDANALSELVLQHFLSDPSLLQDTLHRLEYALEMLDGHANEVGRELARFQVLDQGPPRPIDGLLAAYSPTAHLSDDLFQGKIGFVALLNFPITTLEQRLGEGASWSREQWAAARLTARFEERLPAAIQQDLARVSAAADRYIDSYNIHLDRLAGADFPAGLKLISHWGLRDEIRAQYGRPGGLARQRLIARVMERIITQEIPQAAVNSAEVEWDPEANKVRPPGSELQSSPREEDVRYQHLRQVFQAQRRADPYFPTLPTHIARSFSREREILEGRARELLESVLTSEAARRTGALIRKRLARPLEPFDLWYTGFRPTGLPGEHALDELTRSRYPTVTAFQDDLPRILEQLSFSEETARYLADHIVVDPARGAGHAMGAKRRDDKAHLRTRVGAQGMDYKGFNIAIHELGHNVEQVFSMSRIDHTLLEGVPNTGFTEAFAFLFQARDLELLGKSVPDPKTEAMRTLDQFWSTYEISGVALLDLELWHWMYQHPEASPAELREATVKLARDTWNRYYAPVFGVRDQILPAIYSHIIAYGLYTPDYAIGFLITHQLQAYMKGRKLGTEMERMCRQGRIAPDIWMQQAVGSTISSAPMLAAVETALRDVDK